MIELQVPGIYGMNQDALDSRLHNEVRLLHNGRNFRSNDGRDGTVRNIPGTVIGMDDANFSTDARIIGHAKYSENNSILIFIYDTGSAYGNAIIEYFPETNTYDLVLKEQSPAVLNFSPDHIIRGAYVINGLLYWNDAYNQPRKINIAKAKAFSAGTGGYTVVDEQTVRLIKYPYLNTIKPVYGTDTSRSTNNLRGKLFQFRVAYIYDDKEISAASAISLLALPKDTADYNGEVVGELSKNNVLSFSLNTGHNTVDKIIVYAREGNDGLWGEVEVLDKDKLLAEGKISKRDYADFTYNFYNDSVKLISDQTKINQLFHAVPLLADELGYIHTNQILLAGITEGYDNLTTDVEFNYEINPATSYKLGGLVYSYGISKTTVQYDSEGDVWDCVIISALDNLPAYNNIIVVTIGTLTHQFIVGYEESVDEATFINTLKTFLQDNFGVSAYTSLTDYSGTQVVPAHSILITRIDYTVTVGEYSVVSGSFTSVGAFKSGSSHSFGILYEDEAGREWFVQKAGKLYIPFVTEPDVKWPVATITAVAFTGTGLNDATSGGTFTGTVDVNYRVKIDNKEGSITAFADSTTASGTDTTVTSAAHGLANGDVVKISGTTNYDGTWTIENVTTDTFDIVIAFVADDATGTWEMSPNTFSWSDDGGSTWIATGIALTGAAQALNEGVTITFAATTGHTAGDYWGFTASPPSNGSVSMPAPHTQDVTFGVKWKINHLPPAGAVKYRFCRQKNLDILSYYRYVVGHAGVVAGAAGSVDEGKMLVDISPLNNIQNQTNSATTNNLDFNFPNSIIPAYSFTKGDRIRFITKTKTDFSVTPGLGYILDYYLDLEIIGYKLGADGKNTDIIYVPAFDTTKYPDIGENTLFEIYTPNKGTMESIYYEFGEAYDILTDDNGARYHDGPVKQVITDGVSTTPASGIFGSGDTYITPTLFDKSLASSTATKEVVPIESMNMSNFYKSDSYDIGRPSIVNESFKVRKSLLIRASNKYFEDTDINGLSEFYADKDLFVSADFGDDITGLFEVGFSLKVLQPRKLTTFFVGRQGLQISSDATSQIQATSADVLSTKTPSQEMYGCVNPESVLVINRSLYFADIRNGVIVRDTPNGMMDVGIFGLHSTFNELFTTLKGMDSNRIMASYNPVTKEVGFTFVGINAGVEADLGTYYFNEAIDKWTSKWDYKEGGLCPMGFADINQSYISFVGKKVWLHEKGERNLIYGNQLPLTIEMVFNKGGDKLYRTLEIEGIGTWSCPDVGDVFIGAKNSNIKRDQKSRLLAGKFKNVKGVMIAPFMKDMNTQDGAAPTYNLMNGHALRGNILFLRLTNTDTTEAILDTVVVTSQDLGI